MSLVANAKRLAAAGRRAEASALVGQLLTEACGLTVAGIEIRSDAYSLNSLAGIVTQASGERLFFKFHTEDGEHAGVSEYYRSQLLEQAGVPVDVPVAVSHVVGSQVALYRERTDRRLADHLLAAEHAAPTVRDAGLDPLLLAARRRFDRRVGAAMVASLHLADEAAVVAEPVHQLFRHRLVDAGGSLPGGRYRSFYARRQEWVSVAGARWVVNGVPYRHTLAELAEAAASVLDPAAPWLRPAVVAHGDDHPANLWVQQRGAQLELVAFDPAFAGAHVPALLAPVKATYHSVMAHPFWLYDPGLAADRLTVTVTWRPGEIVVEHDALPWSPLRSALLASLTDEVWLPLLAALDRLGPTPRPPQWRAVLRAGLFSCPFLVLDLLDERRPEPIRWLGLALAVMAGSEPAPGHVDAVSNWLDHLAGPAGESGLADPVDAP